MNEKMTSLAEKFLSECGIKLNDFYIEKTPVSEMLCYKNEAGRDFDLPINNPDLAVAVLLRLKELGVRTVKTG
jgi:hypothetical protein